MKNRCKIRALGIRNMAKIGTISGKINCLGTQMIEYQHREGN